jgi:hypothetical protein|tara:strand:- start:530 stop:805 length:276 start_codon:yes stop_codon:yes gene_type:complete
MSNLLKLSNVPQVVDEMPTVKPMPEDGKRVLALLNDEWIVLEVQTECPTYEETFTAFSYWVAPYSEGLDIEYWEVTTWRDLPELPTKGQNK